MLYVEQLRKRYQLIVGYVGTMVIGAGFVLLLPLVMLLFYRSEVNQAQHFVIPAVLAITVGYFLRTTAPRESHAATLTLTEGGVIVVLSWFVTILFSALPFMLSGQLNFTQAIFEAVSGWTTTGLSVVDVTQTSHLFLFWRSVMQFFGGAGLAVVMLSAIIGPHGLGLYVAEGRSDKLLPNVVRSTKLIMAIYISYVAAGFVLYVIAGMPWFDAINHSIAALSTGGFSTRPESIGAYNSFAIELITVILMLLGTTNFAAHFVLLRGQVRRFLRIGEVRFSLILLSFAIPIVSFFSLRNLYGSVAKGFRIGLFELVSALSTTGFSTVGYGDWDNFAVFALIILMIIGGGTGSTAGGMKLYRVYLMAKSVVWSLRGYLLPRSVVRENYVMRPEGKYYVYYDHITEVANFIAIYLLSYIIGVSVLLLHGYSLQDSMFEFASSLSTVGLSVGITSATAPSLVLWTEIAGMMLGRLEFFVIFFAVIKLVRDLRFIGRHRADTTSL